MITCIVVALIGIMLTFNEYELCGTILIAVAVMLGVHELRDNEVPTALDVYRGKTTLEITYRNSVAIDSTVVYKVK